MEQGLYALLQNAQNPSCGPVSQIGQRIEQHGAPRGFGGLIYKALRSGGWIETLLGSFWAQHPVAAIVALLAAAGVAALVKSYFDRVSMFGKRGDVLVYGCLALGLFFAFKLVVTGTL